MCRFLLPLVLAFVLSGHSGNRSLKLAGSGKKNGVVRSVGQHRQPRLAYLRWHHGEEAAATAEFQKIVDHQGANWGAAWQYPYWGQFYSLSRIWAWRAAARLPA